MASSNSTHCWPAPPWVSPRTLTPVATALFSPMPQVVAIRAIAMDGACGPWSTDATSAASSRAACPGGGVSPRTMSQIMVTKSTVPIKSSIG